MTSPQQQHAAALRDVQGGLRENLKGFNGAAAVVARAGELMACLQEALAQGANLPQAVEGCLPIICETTGCQRDSVVAQQMAKRVATVCVAVMGERGLIAAQCATTVCPPCGR